MAAKTRADDRSASLEHRDDIAEKPSTDVEHTSGAHVKNENYIPYSDEEYNVTFKTWIVVGVCLSPQLLIRTRLSLTKS